MVEKRTVAALPTLRTSRLIVTSFTPGHLTERYVGWLNDPVVVRYSEQRHRKHTLANCRAYLQRVEDSPHFFSAIMTNGSEHIGNIGVQVDAPNRVADLAIMIGDRRFWGQGYGTEAWQAVIEELFENRGVRKITAGTMAENQGMLQIMRKCGMTKEGLRRRHFLLDGREVDLIQMASFRDGPKRK